jgi:glycosyltransferase involved in cell wall biosynthesis
VKSLSIIIPFFNESRTLEVLVEQLALLPKDTFHTCIFVDDGSTDDSLMILKSSLRKVDFKFQILSKENGGKASAIKKASNEVLTSHVLILDADLELKTSDVARLWEVVTSDQANIVFGYRKFLAQSSFTYRFARGNQFISHFYGLLYNEVITDVMCGLKLLPTEILKSCPFRFSNFAIEVEIPLQLWLMRLRPFEIQIDYNPRSRLEGKVIGVKDAIQIMFDLIIFRVRKIRKRIK